MGISKTAGPFMEVIKCSGVRVPSEVCARVNISDGEVDGGIEHYVLSRTLNEVAAADLAESLVAAIIVRLKIDALADTAPPGAIGVEQRGGVDVTRAEIAEYAARLFVSTKIVPLDDTVEADAQ